MIVEILADGGFECVQRGEDATADALLVIKPKKRSTRLSHDAEVGVKCK